MKQEIYIRERKAVHDKYKDKHLSQLRALQVFYIVKFVNFTTGTHVRLMETVL